MYKIIIVLFLAGLCFSCKPENPAPTPPQSVDLPVINNESDLFALIFQQQAFNWYKNDSQRIQSANASAHSPWMRLRFNQIAVAALNDSGKLPINGVFPEGSLLIKELHEGPNDSLRYYAVMYKSTRHTYQNGGWLWGEYEANGQALISLSSRGSLCVGCHQQNARDWVRSFDLHP